jgi:hypothetical protein
MTDTRLPFTTETPVGTLTNKGTFVGFDAYGFAHFTRPDGRKGWAGPAALGFVQVIVQG